LAQHFFDKPHWRAAGAEKIAFAKPVFTFGALRVATPKV
jgi:hypothetical protein